MVAVFQAGKYELDMDAGWAEGDWTGDRRFAWEDMVAAFQDGGYELGARAAVSAVPELEWNSVGSGSILHLSNAKAKITFRRCPLM